MSESQPLDHWDRRACLCSGPSAPPLGPLATAPAATSAATIAAALAATSATTAPESCATMALLRVLVFNHEGRPVAFDMWHNDLQLYLLSDSQDSVSLFDHVSGVAPVPPATADGSTCFQWLTRDATARSAIHNHLPVAECTHFGQHRTAQALYDAVVARYSSPATAALGRLLLPYLFPELLAFATVADLVTHLRTSDARYRATVPAEFLATNQHPMFITLYFIVSRLPDSLRFVKDHFLSLDPTSPTVDLLKQHLLAAETSAVAVGAARGTPRSPFLEGAKRRSSKGKGGQGDGGGSGGGGGGSGSGGGGSGGGGGGSGGGGGGGTGGGSGGSSGGGGGSGGGSGSGGGGTGGGRSGPRRGGPGGGQRQQQQRRSETQSPQQLREWLVQRGTGGGSESCPYVIRTDYDAIIFAMYALSFSAEGDCYRCVPPDPGIAAAALGASASGTPPCTAPAEALHTFTLDSDASLCLFRDSTTLTPLPAPVVARSSTVLPCPAVPSGSLSRLHLPSFSTNLVSTAALQDAMVTTTTHGGQRVSICTCTWTGRHLAMFTRPPGLSLYMLAIEPPHVAASAQVSTSGQVAASCSCRLLSHQTLLWHHHSGHPSLPRLRGMHSHLLVSGLHGFMPPLPPLPALPCLPCVEGRQRAAPHSSSFPPMTAPLQTLLMDVWGPTRVNGQGRERYFLLEVDDYTRYTTVYPLRSKGEVSDVLIPCIRTVRLQLREQFGQDLLVLVSTLKEVVSSPLTSCGTFVVGRAFSSLMEVARTSMIHATAPYFVWPFSVRYAEHQLNLWPRVSLPETSPTMHWTGKVGDATVFRVGGSRAFLHDTSTDKLSARAIPCIFLGSVPDAPGWQFNHSTSRRVLPSQDGYAPSGVSQVDPVPDTALVRVAVGPGAAAGATSGGAASGGTELRGAESEGALFGGAEPEVVERGGAESEKAESGGAEPQGAASSGGTLGASPRQSS
ncbi:unnamed protein product [Closterium sp. NIES-54]